MHLNLLFLMSWLLSSVNPNLLFLLSILKVYLQFIHSSFHFSLVLLIPISNEKQSPSLFTLQENPILTFLIKLFL